MIIDLFNPAHLIVICLLAIAWGCVCCSFDDWFDSARLFPEVLYVLVWVILIVLSFFSFGRLIFIHWNS
jgi:hypothetical protein